MAQSAKQQPAPPDGTLSPLRGAMAGVGLKSPADLAAERPPVKASGGPKIDLQSLTLEQLANLAAMSLAQGIPVPPEFALAWSTKQAAAQATQSAPPPGPPPGMGPPGQPGPGGPPMPPGPPAQPMLGQLGGPPPQPPQMLGQLGRR